MRTLSLIALVALASPAWADDPAPSFELRDRGDAVEVIAHHVRAARTAILPVRSRLEIPIVTGPLAKRIVPGDATVKLVELDSDNAQQMLSVKLGFERLEVKALARFAQAIQVGDDLHVIVPRKLPVDGVAPKLPEPTNMPAVTVAKLEPAKLDAAKLDAKIELAKLDAKPEPARPVADAKPITDARPDLKPIADARPIAAPVLGPALPTAKPAPAAASHATRPELAAPAATKPAPLKPQLATDPDDAWSKIAMYGALGLAAAGAGIWMMKRKKALAPAGSTIEVIAQRSLGGKARVVWLSAGQREMIVSVTGQQVRMLGQWRKTDAPALDQLPAVEPTAADPDPRGALLDKLDQLDQRVQAVDPVRPVQAPAPPRRQTATLEAQRRPTGTLPAQRRPTGTLPAQRPTGAIPVQPAPPVEAALSPAVSGILRLRGRTGQMPAISADVATGDVEADELWAREILAATGARR